MKSKIAFYLCLVLPIVVALIALGAPPGTPPTSKPESAAHADEVRLTDAAIKGYGVRVDEAKLQVLTPTLIAPARISFNMDAMAHVGSIAKGRAVELKVRVGDMVK